MMNPRGQKVVRKRQDLGQQRKVQKEIVSNVYSFRKEDLDFQISCYSAVDKKTIQMKFFYFSI